MDRPRLTGFCAELSIIQALVQLWRWLRKLEKLSELQSKGTAWPGPLCHVRAFASFQPVHAFLPQIQRHMEVVRSALGHHYNHKDWLLRRTSCWEEDVSWSQKHLVALKTFGVGSLSYELWAERGGGVATPGERPGTMQRKPSSPPVPTCLPVAVLEVTLRNVPERIKVLALDPSAERSLWASSPGNHPFL